MLNLKITKVKTMSRDKECDEQSKSNDLAT